MKRFLIFLLIGSLFTHHNVKCDTVNEPSVTQEEENNEKNLIESISEPLSEFNETDLDKMREKSQKAGYQAEVSRMMEIIVNSLYHNKEVFLRELISNSFDALDKVRFYGLKNRTILEPNPNLEIVIKLDPINKILTVTDSGIGMTREELVSNLGTIAKSGTKDFIKKLSAESNNESIGDISSQIGQFGVGFYSVFLVANRVIVASKHVDEEKQLIWEADQNSFNLYEDPRGNTLKRGTTVSLYLNEDSGEFMEEERVVKLIRKYSEFIQFPIYLYSKLDDDKKEVPYHMKHINDIAPLWLRSPGNITEQEYSDFYNVLNYGRSKEKYAKPSGVIHFQAEGETNFRALVFLSDKLDEEYVNAPLMWKMRLKLYVRRVLITTDTKSFLPHYLQHIVGIIDSEDLPLNVGRETLQHNELVKVIKKKLVRKILDYIKKLSQDNETEYERFYLEFGNSIKFGIMEDESNKNRIAKLLRFYTYSSSEKFIGFDDYVSNMKSGQPAIYYITAPTVEDAKRSPYMEKIKRLGYDVIFMLDNIDESVIRSLRVYEGKSLHHIGKEGSDAPLSKSEKEVLEEKEKQFKPLTLWLKKSYFKGRIGAVKVSSRLLTSSCILVASEDGYSGNMDRIIRSQAYVHGKESGFDEVLNQPKNLEINPFHPLTKTMLKYLNEDGIESLDLKESAEVCFNIASLSGGYHIQDNVQLAKLFEKIFLKSQNIPHENFEQNIYDELGIDEEVEKHDHDDKDSESKSENDADATDEKATDDKVKEEL